MSTSAPITFRQYFHPPALAAGLVLLSTIANSLYTAVSDDATREAAVITFVVTASGISLFGIGAAFWGLVAGGVANFVFSTNK
jgi:benzoate membrane transport protein